MTNRYGADVGRREMVRAAGTLDAKRLQQEHHRVVADVDANQLAGAAKVERHVGIQRTRTAVDVHNAVSDLRSAVFLQEMGGTP